MMSVEMFSLAGYEVVALIGQGGLGDVYEARQLSTGATVAVKVLREVAGEPASLHRLQREMEALAALGGQSNVIRLLDVVESDAGPALVMEFAPGGSIAAMMIERERVLNTDEVAFIGEQVASALAAAHQHGIIHRDVKPQNLLVDAYGAVKLCDFGIAAITRSEQFQTRTTALSVRYASPEDLEQDADVGEASDVYSLGATLLHLAHGSPPTLRERVQAWVPPGRPDPIDRDLDEVIAACLQPDPAARPSANDVAHRLDELGSRITPRRRSLGSQPAATPVASAPVAPRPSSEREPPERVQPNEVSADAVPPGDSLRPHAETSRRPLEPVVSGDRAALASRAAITTYDELELSPLNQPTSADRLGPGDDFFDGMMTDASRGYSDDRDAVRRPTFQSEKRTRLVSRVVTVLAVVMVAVLVGTLGWRLFVHRDASSPRNGGEQRTLVAREDGVASLDGARFPTVAVGQCVGREAGVKQAQVVSCADVHDGEVLVVERVPASLEGSFDVQKGKSLAADLCRSIPVPMVQPDPDAQQDSEVQTELQALAVSPSPETWEEGDRRLMCVLAAPNARIAGVTTTPTDGG